MSVPSTEQALTDAHNIAALAATQTGKTSFVRELHATTTRDVSIWVNERGDKRVPGVIGTEARDLEDVRDAIASGASHIEFLPADRNEAIPGLRRLLWQVAERTDRELELQVIVDEVERVAPQSGKQYGNLPHRDAVRDFTSEGVKRNVKFIGITQDPATYDKQALGNSRYRAVWNMSAERRRAVSKYGFDWDAVEEAPQYTGILHYMSGTVIGQVRAAEEYAT